MRKLPTAFTANLFTSAGCLAIGLAMSAAPAMAEEAADDRNPDEPEIVVTASGFEQKIVDAPASISVVSAEELKQRPYITLIDAVRDLEGVDVGETSDKTGQRSISIRGMGSDYTLVLIDGKRQNNHGDIYPNNFGGNQFNYVPPLDTIERVEVIRGPASTLYGADALGGVINIITKGVADRWTGSATVGRSFQGDKRFGDDTTFDAALTGPIIPGLLGVSVRGSIYKRDPSSPEFASVTDPDGVETVRPLGFGSGGRTVDNTNKSAGISLSFTPSDTQRLVFDYDISKQKYDNSPSTDPGRGTVYYPLGTLDSIETIWRRSGSQVSPRVGYAAGQKFDRENWAISHYGTWGDIKSFVSLAYVKTSNNGRTMPFSVAERRELQGLWDAACVTGGETAECSKASLNNLTAAQRAQVEAFLPRPKRNLESSQYTVDARVDIPVNGMMGDHRFIIGGQYINGDLKDGIFGLEASVAGTAAVQKQKMWAVFAEDNWKILDALTITGGIRYDKHAVFGDRFSPRLYGVYTISPSWTVKGGVSTGFKTPKTTDIYDGITGFGGQGTRPWAGNPDLKPETSVNMEAALYWTAQTARHNFNITFFQNDFNDKIVRLDIDRSCLETNGVRPCANLGDYGAIDDDGIVYGLGTGSTTRPYNVDKARTRGIEIAGQYEFFDGLTLRANYTLTDSKQLTGASQGQPLTNTSKHMANASVNWNVTDSFSTQLSAQMRSTRFAGLDDNDNWLYYKGYTVVNFGAQYEINDNITISGRVNNLLDKDFTSYQTVFKPVGGGYEPSFVDDYNNKDKRRSFWLSASVRF